MNEQSKLHAVVVKKASEVGVIDGHSFPPSTDPFEANTTTIVVPEI